MKSFAQVYSRSYQGFKAPQVIVEAHISHGPSAKFSIVGLAETAVKESKDRVRSAILNSHFRFPESIITINLAPADLPKEGGRFDLPIALSILVASGQLPQHCLSEYEFAGELALSGELRGIQGALPFAIATHQANKTLIIAKESADEAALPSLLTVLAAQHLLEVCAHLTDREHIKKYESSSSFLPRDELDLSEVKGQLLAKRALEIAAAGGHSVLMVGPPGTGKTMLAQRFCSLLPKLNEEEALEVAAIYSLSKSSKPIQWQQRPFRSPHHTASYPALVGGNNPPQPGEVSLAHHGVLFLDELTQFNTRTLETLREPLENGSIHIARSGNTIHFPAKFQLIAAMNPCPCGFAGDPEIVCYCHPDKIQRYQNKLSGPLLDRIDLHLKLPRLTTKELLQDSRLPSTNSTTVRQRVLAAREKQIQDRQTLNCHLSSKELDKLPLSSSLKQLLNQHLQNTPLSPRSYYRLLRVARTIADLEGHHLIEEHHLNEAMFFKK